MLADYIGDLRVYLAKIIASISSQENRHIVLIDNEQKAFENICYAYNNCEYLASIEEINMFMDNIKNELNERLEGTDRCNDKLFIIIPDFNGFFNMISDEQAEFWRKVVKYINLPKFGIQFFTGYDVQGSKLMDRIFQELVINAQSYIICPGAIELASKKLEKLTLISNAKNSSAYFVMGEAVAEIRW